MVAGTLYAALGVVALRPQSLRPWDTVAYVGDSLDSAYFMAWNAHQVVHDPLHLFDANILFPHGNAMALAGHRILPGIATAPVQWLTGNPILAYNVAVGLGYLLAAFAGRHLALSLGLCRIGAWAAGALYAFHTFQINEAPRVDLLYHGFATLALAELLRHLRGSGSRHAWAVAGLMTLQGYASNYLLLYGALLLAIVTAGALVARPRQVAPRLVALALPALAAALAFSPVIAAQLAAARTYTMARAIPDGVSLEHFVSTLPTNLVWGAIGVPVRPQQQGPHFVGLLAIALALVALWLAARGRARAGPGASSAPGSNAIVAPSADGRGAAGPDALPARVWVPVAFALALLCASLSFGRDVWAFGREWGRGPYALVHAYVPVFAFVRIPERWSLFAMLFVALLAGEAISRLARGRSRVLALALAAALPLEHLSTVPMTTQVPVGDAVPAVYRFLATDAARAVAEVPVHGDHLVRMETLEEFFSTCHWKPVIHGYVSYPPLLTTLLRRAAAGFPAEDSQRILRRAGVDTVVIHHGRQGSGAIADALGEALAAGRIAQVATFPRAVSPVEPAGRDEVVRLRPLGARAAAPAPAGRALRDPAWRWSATAGEAAAACDGDLTTTWTVPGELRGDERLEVLFPGPVRLAGVVIPLRAGSVFPTSFRLEGRNADGTWRRLARLEETQLLQLVDQLLAHPGWGDAGFDLSGRGEVWGLRLLPTEGSRGFDGWRIPELEIRVP